MARLLWTTKRCLKKSLKETVVRENSLDEKAIFTDLCSVTNQENVFVTKSCWKVMRPPVNRGRSKSYDTLEPYPPSLPFGSWVPPTVIASWDRIPPISFSCVKKYSPIAPSSPFILWDLLLRHLREGWHRQLAIDFFVSSTFTNFSNVLWQSHKNYRPYK